MKQYYTLAIALTSQIILNYLKDKNPKSNTVSQMIYKFWKEKNIFKHKNN